MGRKIMKIFVDISIFTEADAFGRISGDVSVPIPPQIGDLMFFDLSKGGETLVEAGIYFDALKVTDRIIPIEENGKLSVTLSDITVKTRDDATKVVNYLEEHYTLFGEPYEK
jgi:hypothetical protein